MQLTTDVKTNIILFKDKSKLWINENDYQKLVQINDNNVKFKIDGNVYDYFDVSKVLTREEYYQEYPDDRPMNFDRIVTNYAKPSRKRALQGMIKGLEQFINGSDQNDKAKRLLDKIQARLINL